MIISFGKYSMCCYIYEWTKVKDFYRRAATLFILFGLSNPDISVADTQCFLYVRYISLLYVYFSIIFSKQKLGWMMSHMLNTVMPHGVLYIRADNNFYFYIICTLYYVQCTYVNPGFVYNNTLYYYIYYIYFEFLLIYFFDW